MDVVESRAGPDPAPPQLAGEVALLAALRRGEEAAFEALVDRYHASMIRVARLHVASDAAAEEVAQDAWLGVLRGLDAFEGRSSLKAWIFSIVSNCAKTRGVRDRRQVPLSSLAAEEGEDEGGPSVAPERFLGEDHPRWPGHWSAAPEAWSADALEAQETLEAVARAMEGLPRMQRAVMTLRDVEGLGPEETCRVLGITDGNHRVLLHRARSKVRAVLEHYMKGEVER